MSTKTNSAPPEKTEFVRALPVLSIINIATLYRIFDASALVTSPILLGGNLCAFINISSNRIVIGGIFGITVTCYSFRDIGTALTIIMSTTFYHTRNPDSAALRVLQLADLSHLEVLLALALYVSHLMNEEMLHKRLKMLPDGSSRDRIERMIHGDIQAAARRHSRTLDVLRRMAEISPAIGLISTFFSLLKMPGKLIQARPAVALLTIFYGAAVANMISPPSLRSSNGTRERII